MRALIARDRWIPLVFCAGMVVVVAVNAVMVAIALLSDNGLVDDRPFARGLAYNRVIAEAERQDALGWRVEVSVAPEPGAQARVAVRLTSRDGAPLAGARIEGALLRPVERLEPVAFAPVERAPGLQEAIIALPRRGQWDVSLAIHRDGETVDVQRRVFVR